MQWIGRALRLTFLSPTRTEWPTCMLQFIGWSRAAALMRTLINAVNAGHGGKWVHAKGYIRRLIREILKKVMRRQKRTGGSTTHVPTMVKEYAVILKKEKTLLHASACTRIWFCSQYG